MKVKAILKWSAILLFTSAIVLQFFRPERINPPVNVAETLEANAEVTEGIKAVFSRSCNDCHSNETVFPWYSNISPVSWSVVDHIEEGRRELNFSIWGTYDAKKKRKKLREICEEVESGAMPHNQYLWIHWDAKLQESDKKMICDWTKAELAKLPLEGE